MTDFNQITKEIRTLVNIDILERMYLNNPERYEEYVTTLTETQERLMVVHIELEQTTVDLENRKKTYQELVDSTKERMREIRKSLPDIDSLNILGDWRKEHRRLKALANREYETLISLLDHQKILMTEMEFLYDSMLEEARKFHAEALQ